MTGRIFDRISTELFLVRESGTIHPVPPNPIPQLQVLVLQVVTVRPASKRRLLDSHGSLAKTVLSEHGGANVSTARSFFVWRYVTFQFVRARPSHSVHRQTSVQAAPATQDAFKACKVSQIWFRC